MNGNNNIPAPVPPITLFRVILDMLDTPNIDDSSSEDDGYRADGDETEED